MDKILAYLLLISLIALLIFKIFFSSNTEAETVDKDEIQSEAIVEVEERIECDTVELNTSDIEEERTTIETEELITPAPKIDTPSKDRTSSKVDTDKQDKKSINEKIEQEAKKVETIKHEPKPDVDIEEKRAEIPTSSRSEQQERVETKRYVDEIYNDIDITNNAEINDLDFI